MIDMSWGLFLPFFLGDSNFIDTTDKTTSKEGGKLK